MYVTDAEVLSQYYSLMCWAFILVCWGTIICRKHLLEWCLCEYKAYIQEKKLLTETSSVHAWVMHCREKSAGNRGGGIEGCLWCFSIPLSSLCVYLDLSHLQRSLIMVQMLSWASSKYRFTTWYLLFVFPQPSLKACRQLFHLWERQMLSPRFLTCNRLPVFFLTA